MFQHGPPCHNSKLRFLFTNLSLSPDLLFSPCLFRNIPIYRLTRCLLTSSSGSGSVSATACGIGDLAVVEFLLHMEIRIASESFDVNLRGC